MEIAEKMLGFLVYNYMTLYNKIENNTFSTELKETLKVMGRFFNS